MKKLKWVKHGSDAVDNPKMLYAMHQLGIDAYAVYWIAVEGFMKYGDSIDFTTMFLYVSRYFPHLEKSGVISQLLKDYDFFDFDEETNMITYKPL